MHQDLVLRTSYNEVVYGNKWITDKELIGNLIIIHGMAEYSFRYNDFALYLNTLGFNVYAVDHVGHGKNVTVPESPLRGYGVWPLDGFELCIKQVHELSNYIKKENNAKICVFGHSMGSFIVQRYYQLYSEDVSAVVICGSSSNNSGFKFSRFLTTILKPFLSEKKRNKPSKLFGGVQNSQYMAKMPKKFSDGYQSDFMWLSFNEENVKKYDSDPGCGYLCSFNFYYSISKNLQILFNKKNMQNIKNKVPVYIISGDNDPVGNYGKAVIKLYNIYQKTQDNVSLELFKNMRHEILNEDDRLTVYNHIAKFLKENI